MQEESIGKLNEISSKKEASKLLNTIVEEKHREAKHSDSLDEQEVSLDEHEAVDFEEHNDDIMIAANQDKVSFTIKATIPKIMISKDRIAV